MLICYKTIIFCYKNSFHKRSEKRSCHNISKLFQNLTKIAIMYQLGKRQEENSKLFKIVNNTICSESKISRIVRRLDNKSDYLESFHISYFIFHISNFNFILRSEKLKFVKRTRTRTRSKLTERGGKDRTKWEQNKQDTI